MKYMMTCFQKLRSEVYMKVKYYGDKIEKVIKQYHYVDQLQEIIK